MASQLATLSGKGVSRTGPLCYSSCWLDILTSRFFSPMWAKVGYAELTPHEKTRPHCWERAAPVIRWSAFAQRLTDHGKSSIMGVILAAVQ